jgi:hypothetical protein
MVLIRYKSFLHCLVIDTPLHASPCDLLSFYDIVYDMSNRKTYINACDKTQQQIDMTLADLFFSIYHTISAKKALIEFADIGKVNVDYSQKKNSLISVMGRIPWDTFGFFKYPMAVPTNAMQTAITGTVFIIPTTEILLRSSSLLMLEGHRDLSCMNYGLTHHTSNFLSTCKNASWIFNG